jgi:S-adenosylmethionine:tRNA ribosyltransferase-isomerase
VSAAAATAPFSFVLPPLLAAGEPPEARGLARDHVRLLVLDRASRRVAHARFDRLGHYLRPGDLVVFNTSRTLPAALPATASGRRLEARLAERLPDGTWLVLAVGEEGRRIAVGRGERLAFGAGLSATVVGHAALRPWLARLRFSASGAELMDRIHRLGRPIRYEHVSGSFGLESYQTVFAREPGSAEMPSAGRAFTWRQLFDLEGRGVQTASVLLHTGLSSYLDDELDRRHEVAEEEFEVGDEAADRVRSARARGGRVIAVGTTVARALETAASVGDIVARRGYTRLRLDARHRLRAVDGLLTGLHEPEASHLDLLTAFAPAEAIQAAYLEAIRERYLWHEFGDLNLIV